MSPNIPRLLCQAALVWSCFLAAAVGAETKNAALKKAESAHRRGNHERELQILDKALSKERSRSLLVATARAYLELDELGAAAEYAKEAWDHAIGSHERHDAAIVVGTAYRRKAEFLRALERPSDQWQRGFEEAAEWFTLALDQQSGDSLTSIALGDCLAAVGDYVGALTALDQVDAATQDNHQARWIAERRRVWKTIQETAKHQNVSGELVQPPHRLSSPPPRYPALARENRIQGSVILDLIINTEGQVRPVDVVQGLPHGLTREAVDAVIKWQFEAASLGGQPVPYLMRVKIDFTLH